MKVVLFCGGRGTRMRSDLPGGTMPKPMQLVGPRPLVWHVMRYYAHFGHKEFILCLGYGAQHIKDFFLTYQETGSNDFVLRDGRVELLSTDISDWRISLIDTGLDATIGERLRRVRPFLGDDEMFLANYADVLTDAPLPDIIARFAASDAGASMMVVPPTNTFHVVDVGEGGQVGAITPVAELPLWVNGGFFVLRQEVFEHLPRDGDLVADACAELAKRGRLIAYPHRGYWRPSDTVNQRLELDSAWAKGERPWALWGEVTGLRPAGLGAVVALGAHCDDLAIGAGGTLLTLCAGRPGLRVDALVLSGGGTGREDEERAALAAFCPGADLAVTVLKLPDGRLPAHWDEAKNALEDLRARTAPDLILAPWRGDAHQDHRGLAGLVPTVWRGCLALGYEIVKWDGDLGRPSVYQPLAPETAEAKARLLQEHYPSQRHRPWYDRETFLGLARVRGVECGARYAEAFHTDKIVIDLASGG